MKTMPETLEKKNWTHKYTHTHLHSHAKASPTFRKADNLKHTDIKTNILNIYTMASKQILL